MRWPKISPGLETRLRVVLLGVAIAASVALPYTIIRSDADRMLQASGLVLHTLNVKETLFELGFQMSELESLALGEIMDIYPGEDRPGYADVRARVMPLFDKLEASTRDNVEQSSRIGSLRVLLEGRLNMLDSALAQARNKNFDAALNTLNEGAKLFGSREVSWKIVSTEDALLKERSERLAQNRRISGWATAGALLAQLLLLGSVVYVSERQAQHRRIAEGLARMAVERSRMIVQTMREPIAVLDTSLRLLMANEAFRELYAGVVVGANDIVLGDVGEGNWDDPDLLQRLADVGARGREIWDYELNQRSADGIERVVLVNARRMDLSNDAEPDARRTILLTVSDVTARKRNEQRIRELNQDLESKVEQVSEVNRELESFSYSVSHDLRAPLRHIAGFTSKLGSHINEGSDEKTRHYLEVIGDSARRMSALIEDLLEYSRLGRSSLRIMPVNMDALVDEVRALLLDDEARREIEWQVGVLPAAMGDESMLRRVWQNLIGNAIKYTSKRTSARIEISADSSGSDEVVYSVRDNGTGFDMAYSSKLFGVFQRLHKASEFPGTGIGLANVRRIVGRHGGRVWAESAPDQGATFHFSLPVMAGAVKSNESRNES